jgi:cell fate (sporulation/competence/biofilm development) regulator YlbF (YheA/YmcA/DUF963 family)
MECYAKAIETEEYKKVQSEYDKLKDEEKFKRTFDKYVSLSLTFSSTIN